MAKRNMSKIEISYCDQEEAERIKKLLAAEYKLGKKGKKDPGKEYKKTYIFLEPK